MLDIQMRLRPAAQARSGEGQVGSGLATEPGRAALDALADEHGHEENA